MGGGAAISPVQSISFKSSLFRQDLSDLQRIYAVEDSAPLH